MNSPPHRAAREASVPVPPPEAGAAIDVTGSENQVTWKRAVGAKKPKVNRTGHNNKVTQAR